MTLHRGAATAAVRRQQAAIRLAVVDDNVFLRTGLAHVLAAEPALEVVAESATVREGLSALRARQPHVVLLGVASGGREPYGDVAELRRATPVSRIVAMLAHDDPGAVRRLLAAGAQAAIAQYSSPEELIGTIRGVAGHRDRVVLSVSQRTLAGLRETGPHLLTARELQVVALVARGLRNSQIARELVITEGTVKRHLSNVYAKLDAACRTEAVRKAVERGMVRTPVPITDYDLA
ncbi:MULTISPECIES: response regulator transcription factor [Streptomycetaceae]|uniref:Putative DNA binding regulatory protein n=1 Tax=Streptantibioticus cattleyicolor (strain ATCC 35852 / DSM 46488 / JCM 4925 / NBRC 14057 / NRRL 8057) TaxID=1003195 RepID=F8JPG2_STREN|nr:MULTISPECIES: response regulator transcription factor [Streptomycetaceae]AEW96523.1 putative DNA binding regulatory protein [Streptantibioticus cattleyicolor NRRL 8057 = DSM 46488]MYS61024.1 response regulator [Streptomyces sp. SID5468]CCB76859.1 putative DNA binding regulatory protein [Streptantibioticus cattleyicolor NRRL 8057 = DSM 46488]